MKIEVTPEIEEEIEELLDGSLLPTEIAIQALLKIGLKKVKKTPTALARAIGVTPGRRRKKNSDF